MLQFCIIDDLHIKNNMSSKAEEIKYSPTNISLHQKSKILQIEFDNGKKFDLPCEYLRVYSPAAEVKLLPQVETGKENVNIDEIEAQGTYAIRLSFDDGHNTGIYSWGTLYQLGEQYQQKWADYLKQLEKIGYQREQDKNELKPRKVKILYFNYLVNKLYKDNEEYELPEQVTTVEALLTWLQKIKLDLGYLLAPESIRVTVNKQFSEPFTLIEDGDEIGIIPNSPTPPKRD